MTKTRLVSNLITAGAALVLSAGMLMGCSSTTPQIPAGTRSLELSFDLSKCQQLEANLFKCPAIDKPICAPEYSGSQADECVRIGKKGRVFVTGPVME